MKRIAAAGLAAALVLSASACSSDDDKVATPDTTVTTQAPSETTDPAGADTTEVEAPAEGETEVEAPVEGEVEILETEVADIPEAEEEIAVDEGEEPEAPSGDSYFCEVPLGETCGYNPGDMEDNSISLSVEVDERGIYWLTVSNQTNGSQDTLPFEIYTVQAVDADGNVVVDTPEYLANRLGKPLKPVSVMRTPLPGFNQVDLTGTTIEVQIDWLPLTAFTV